MAAKQVSPPLEAEALQSDLVSSQVASKQVATAATPGTLPDTALPPAELPVIAGIKPETRFDPASWPPLPASDRPLGEIWPVLKDRADQGDHQAACRMTLELRACFDMDRRLKIVSDIVEDRSNSNDPGVEATLTHAEKLLGQSERCAQIPEADRNDWRYIRQAARAGNVAAMETFALEHWLPIGNPHVSVAELKQILSERDYLLVAAAKSGSLVARTALVSRLGPVYSGLALDRDAGLSAVERAQIVAAMTQLASPSTEATQRDDSVLTDAERVQVEAMVKHLRAEQARLNPERSDRSAMNPDETCAKAFINAPDLSKPLDWRRELGLQQ